MKKKVADAYHYKPLITRTDLKKVFDTLLSDKLTVSGGGGQLRHFEKRFAAHHKHKDALMYTNDSLALFAILYDIGVKKGDEILISSFSESFIGETILFMGARPIFVDCLPNSLLMDLEKAKSLANPRTRALIYSYPFGYGDALTLRDWMDNRRESFPIFPVIEDATQALGCSYFLQEKWRPVGTVGDYALFSLFASRVLTSGKGAVVLSKNPQKIVTLSHLRGGEGNREKDSEWQLIPRLDFVPTEIEASLATSQFSILEKNLERRKYIAEQLQQVFVEKGESFFMAMPSAFVSNHYAYVMIFSTHQERLDVKNSFEQAGIGGLEEMENLAYLKSLAGENEGDANGNGGATNNTHLSNHLPNTADVLARILILSVSLDISDDCLKKMVSLLSSLNKMQLVKKS